MPTPTIQDSIHDWQADEGMTDATMLASQLEVIADELRTANRHAETANMIAFYTMSDEDAVGLLRDGTVTNEQFKALARRIVERLGLA